MRRRRTAVALASVCGLLLVANTASGGAPNGASGGALNGNHIIRSNHGCDRGHPWCNARLSWDRAAPHAFVTIEHNDPILWQITPVDGVRDGYRVRSTYGCDKGDELCNAELSWDTKDPHPIATIEHDDHVIWRITPVPGVANGYRVQSTYGCDRGHRWCNAELSWDNRQPHPIATLKHNDPVVWIITRDESEDMARVRALLMASPATAMNRKLSLDPSNTPCAHNSECSNDRYVGVCRVGQCDSLGRASCETPGRVEACIRSVGVEHYRGVRVCKPSYLSGKRWGDCVRYPVDTHFGQSPATPDDVLSPLDNKGPSGLGTLTIDANKSPCTRDGDCNNLRFEGRCHEGRCQVLARDACDVPEQLGVCVPQFGRTCVGIRKCRPDYLTKQYWGDCECKRK